MPLTGLLPLRSARRLLYAALASLFVAIAVLGGVGAGGLGLLVVSACVVAALTLSALAAIAAFRALGAGPRAPLLRLMLIFCSGGAAAACLEVGLGAQLGLEARLAVVGLLTASASLLTPASGEDSSSGSRRIDGRRDQMSFRFRILL